MCKIDKKMLRFCQYQFELPINLCQLLKVCVSEPHQPCLTHSTHSIKWSHSATAQFLAEHYSGDLLDLIVT